MSYHNLVNIVKYTHFFNKLCLCAQVKGQKPPAPVRGVKSAGEAGGGEEEEVEGEDDGPVEDLVPRTDIR